MAMFANRAGKNGPFGLPTSPFDVMPSYGTPGFGDVQASSMDVGLPDAGAPIDIAGPQISPVEANVKGPSKVWDYIGLAGDALQSIGGGRPSFVPLQMQLQEQAREERLAELKRQQGWEDWRRQWDYQTANPKAPQDTEFERLLASGGFSEAEKVNLRRRKAENDANPFQAVRTTDEAGRPGLTFIRPGEEGGDQGVSGGNLPSVSDQASYDRIQPGQQYKTPDGQIRVKGGAPSQGGGSFP